jgi:hypothetical protein
MVYKIDLSTQKSRCAIVELLKAVSIMPIDHRVGLDAGFHLHSVSYE